MTEKLNAEGIIQLEAPFITIPLNQLTKTTRTSQKYVEKEIAGTLVNTVTSLVTKCKSNAPDAEIVKNIEGMIDRLSKLKRRVRYPIATGPPDHPNHRGMTDVVVRDVETRRNIVQ
jgi:hypothetical protein